MTSSSWLKKDPREVLGVGKNAGADEIRYAYRNLARQNHPDTNNDTGTEERLKEINEAYNLLSGSKNHEGVTSSASTYSTASVKEESPGHSQDWQQRRPNEATNSNYGQAEELVIPEPDFGLLFALRKAFQSQKPFHWSVKYPENHKFKWLEKYVVGKEIHPRTKDEEVRIWANIGDFSKRGFSYNSSFQITNPSWHTLRHKRKGRNSVPIMSFSDISWLIDEDDLAKPEKFRGEILIPKGIQTYLDSLKTLAKDSADEVNIDSKEFWLKRRGLLAEINGKFKYLTQQSPNLSENIKRYDIKDLIELRSKVEGNLKLPEDRWQYEEGYLTPFKIETEFELGGTEFRK